jgi:hypothetical protein
MNADSDTEVHQELLERIRAKRASIDAFVRDLEARGDRLTNLSIICSAMVTALTAGPALGGERFTAGTAGLFNVGDQSLIWRLLCLAAVILSIMAAITTNMYKSHDVAARLAKAQAANVGLEGLETLIEFRQIPVDEAVKQYQRYIAEIPFVRGRLSAAR